jgi:hypothetical protein
MFTFDGKTYDFLKAVALVWLPAAGTLYFAIAAIWGLPDAGNVIGTITAIDTALGGALKISSSGYSTPVTTTETSVTPVTPGTLDGSLVVDKTHPDKNVYSIELDTPFEELENKQTFLLGVKHKE